MSPKGIRKQVEGTIPATATDLNVPKMTSEDIKKAHFLEIEVVPPVERSPLNIYNANPMYAYRYCNKDMMGNGRRGIWHTVPKDHPDFSGLRVEVDHSVGQNFFSYKDVILCCARKETADSKRKRLAEKIERRDKALKIEEDVLIKATKESLREGINTLEKAIEKSEDALVS